MIINRHGNFDARELYRLLKKGGIFVTQQVGGDNDRDLVEMVLPEVESSFPHLNLEETEKCVCRCRFSYSCCRGSVSTN